MARLLEVSNLKTQFKTDEGIARAVDGISFHIDAGETVGLVGESGCGKSVTSLSIMRLHSGDIVEGDIKLEGKSILAMSKHELQEMRGQDISMIFQDPMTSLDPVFTVGYQLRETIRRHRNISKAEADKIAVSLLEQVGIPQPELRMKSYPHELSGGMRQRVMIAIAMSCEAKLLIADEPTTALDMTIQAQILDLMRQIKKEKNNAILLITHDLGVVAEMCDRVLVMYCGKIVETGTVLQIFKNPLHPYTKGLLGSIPSLDQQKERLNTIQGVVPSITCLPTGCRFHPRCSECTDVCREVMPEMTEVEPNHFVACCLCNNH